MSAIFSPCRTWRYTLMRLTDRALLRDLPGEEQAAQARAHMGGRYEQPQLRTVAFIGLNPSTADETTDDPTVRRCVGFASRWGFERMVMLNVFAFRATNPRRLRAAADPVGPENDNWILREAAAAQLVVCAWGAHAVFLDRGREVAGRLRGINVPLHSLAFTKGGEPRHPLYLRGDLEPVPWT